MSVDNIQHHVIQTTKNLWLISWFQYSFMVLKRKDIIPEKDKVQRGKHHETSQQILEHCEIMVPHFVRFWRGKIWDLMGLGFGEQGSHMQKPQIQKTFKYSTKQTLLSGWSGDTPEQTKPNGVGNLSIMSTWPFSMRFNSCSTITDKISRNFAKKQNLRHEFNHDNIIRFTSSIILSRCGNHEASR